MGALAIAVDQNISLLRTNGALAAFNSVFGVQWLLPAANRSASRICSRAAIRALAIIQFGIGQTFIELSSALAFCSAAFLTSADDRGSMRRMPSCGD